MCFSIPCKVIKVNKNTVLIEGGKTIRIGKDFSVRLGEYLQVVGNIAVGKLAKSEGIKIRRLIKKLNH